MFTASSYTTQALCHLWNCRGPVFTLKSFINLQPGKNCVKVETIADISELERLDQKVESLSRKLTDGDIFLDEIGDISESAQVKLLRVLENKQVERVGDHRPIRVDVRIISATNKNIADLITVKQFREDLFFRINVIPIQLPPLRERKEDIPLLVQHFIRRLRRSTGKPIEGLSPVTLQQFMDHSWPGNIRELKSALAFAFVVAEGGSLDLEHLPPQLGGGSRSCDPPAVEHSTEKEALIMALHRTSGNQTQAARLLGVNRVTVWNRMRKYGVDSKKIPRA